MPINDIRNDIAVFYGTSEAITTDTTTTVGDFDLQEYGTGFAVALGASAYTDGTYTLAFLDSDDDVTYTAVAAADLVGSYVAVSAATTQLAQMSATGYVGAKRYLRVTIVSTSTSSGATVFCAAIGNKEVKPVL